MVENLECKKLERRRADIERVMLYCINYNLVARMRARMRACMDTITTSDLPRIGPSAVTTLPNNTWCTRLKPNCVNM